MLLVALTSCAPTEYQKLTWASGKARFFFSSVPCPNGFIYRSEIQIGQQPWYQATWWTPTSPTTFQYLDESGRAKSLFAHVVLARDALNRNINWDHPDQATLAGAGTCVDVIAIPWAGVRDRPWYVEPQTLDDNLQSKTRLSFFATYTSWGIFLLFTVGAGFVWIGFLPDESRSKRSSMGAGCLVFAVAGSLLLAYVGDQAIQTPLELQQQVKSYYSYYDALPKVGPNLLPLNGDAALRLFRGPPGVLDFGQNCSAYVTWLIILVIIGLVIFGVHIYRGIYWVFVPLPLKVRFESAVGKGRFLTAEEVIDAVRAGTTGKNTWQSKMMARKAEEFSAELEARRAGYTEKTNER